MSKFATLARSAFVVLFFFFALESCMDDASGPSVSSSTTTEEAPVDGTLSARGLGAPPRGLGAPPRALFLGTSLSAGYGLALEEAFPARLAELLGDRGMPIEAINAGVSGDTSAGGLHRLDWLLREPPELILVELGANDGLRGLAVDMTEANLLEVVTRAQATGARVIVAGMLMPPNLGEDYTRDFAAIFPRVASATGSQLVPFLLEGVAADPTLNLADGIHPNHEGHARIAQTLLPYFMEALAAQGKEETVAP